MTSEKKISVSNIYFCLKRPTNILYMDLEYEAANVNSYHLVYKIIYDFKMIFIFSFIFWKQHILFL